MDLSVVLPVINERDNLLALVPQLKTVLKRAALTFDIIAIDGGSLDGTREVAAELGARVVPEPPARLRGGDRDRAGRSPRRLRPDFGRRPVARPQLRTQDVARTLGDIVIASRYVRGGASHGLRKELSRLLNEVHRWVLLMPVRDLSSGFRLCRREAIEGIKLE